MFGIGLHVTSIDRGKLVNKKAKNLCFMRAIHVHLHALQPLSHCTLVLRISVNPNYINCFFLRYFCLFYGVLETTYLLSLFITRLQREEKKQHKAPKDPKGTSAAKSESEESLVDDDEDMEQDSDDSAEEGAKKPAKPAKKVIAAKQNGKADDAKKGKPKDDKFFLFIGNLPVDITDVMVCFILIIFHSLRTIRFL